MNNSGKRYYDDFYFSLIQTQYEYYKKVLNEPDKFVLKDIGLPSEIIFALGLTPAIIESIVGLKYPSQSNDQLLKEADKYFYGSGVCSFNKLALPVFESGGLPLPQAFACVALCQEAANNFAVLARKFKKEYFAVDIPYLPYQYSQETVKYVARQFEELAHSLSGITGNGFDIDRLRQVIRNSNQASGYIYAGNELRKKRPALFFGGQMLKFTNIRIFFGTNDAVNLAKKYYEICQEKSSSSSTSVNERYRILWCNFGLMYDDSFFEYMEKDLGAVIAFEEMNYSPSEPMDEKKPFLTLAKRFLDTPFIGDARKRANFLTQAAKEYHIDGIVNFSHLNCRLFNPKLRLIKEALNKEKIPLLELSGDSLDKKNYSRAQLTTRLEAFIEMLAASKR